MVDGHNYDYKKLKELSMVYEIGIKVNLVGDLITGANFQSFHFS